MSADLNNPVSKRFLLISQGEAYPDVVTRQERVPRKNLCSSDTVFSPNAITIVAGLGNVGLGACGRRSSRRNTDWGVLPDIRTVNE